MRNKRKKRPLLGLFLVLILAGCSGSTEILQGSRERAVADEVTEVLQLVVLPAVERLVAFSPVNQPAPPGSEKRTAADPECAHFDPLCRSGRFEVCRGPSAGATVFRYDRCERSTGTIDGGWELVRDGLRASGKFDLSLGGMSFGGRIDYVLDDMCWRNEFDSFTAARGGHSVTIDGIVDYCFESGAGNGKLRVSVSGPADPIAMSVQFDARSGTVVVMRGEVTELCRFDRDRGVATCGGD